MVDKCFKIPEGKEFDKNLPSSIAYYPNLHFKNFIPDKDINEKMLAEDPVSSNLQKLSVLDDFLKALLVSQTAISTEKFQDRIFQVESALSWLWK